MKNAPGFITLILMLTHFNSCVLPYHLHPGKWMCVATQKTCDRKGDSTITTKFKKHLFLRGYSQQETHTIINSKDTTIKVTDNWYALGRVSPNTRQLRTVKIKKYSKEGALLYKEKREYSFLLFDVSVTRKVISFDESGKRTVVRENEAPYDLMEKGLPGGY